MKKKIEEILKEHGKPEEYEDYDFLWHEIDCKITLPFEVSVRSSVDGDCWLQSEYYSPKLKKVIILDYDFDKCDNADDIIEQIEATNAEIKQLEALIK